MYTREYAKQCVGHGWYGLIDDSLPETEPHNLLSELSN